jgi:signal peptidase I
MVELERKYHMPYKPEDEKIPDQKLPENNSQDQDDIPEDDFEEDESYDSMELTGRPEYTSSVRGIIYDLVFYTVLIFACIYIIPNFVLQRTIVDGVSMENTLHNGDQLYVEKLSYRFDAIKRFDIIVFYPKGREEEEYYVKRVIGLPGETVQIIGDDIYINGSILEEDYGNEPILDPGRAAIPVTLGEDEYFVMGDNRNHSKDSRTDYVGNVKKANIGGRAFLRIKPFDEFGPID